jgi:hypothetical protein
MNKRSINFIFRLLLLTLLFGTDNWLVLAKEVINPEKFSGPVATGYRAAQKSKEICVKLFCYCGCDLTDEHTSLLDCFTCMHGVDCPICQEEAIIAHHMKGQGKTLGQIQRTIDEKFSVQYPWDKPSPALERYLKTIRAYRDTDSTYSVKPVVKAALGTKYNTKAKVSIRKKKSHCCGH